MERKDVNNAFVAEQPQNNTKLGAKIWDSNEHMLFLAAYQMYPQNWAKIADHVKTRSLVQVRSHAQKYFQNQGKDKKKAAQNKQKAQNMTRSRAQRLTTQQANPSRHSQRLVEQEPKKKTKKIKKDQKGQPQTKKPKLLTAPKQPTSCQPEKLKYIYDITTVTAPIRIKLQPKFVEWPRIDELPQTLAILTQISTGCGAFWPYTSL